MKIGLTGALTEVILDLIKKKEWNSNQETENIEIMSKVPKRQKEYYKIVEKGGKNHYFNKPQHTTSNIKI